MCSIPFLSSNLILFSLVSQPNESAIIPSKEVTSPIYLIDKVLFCDNKCHIIPEFIPISFLIIAIGF
jgi:hypothetical protein